MRYKINHKKEEQPGNITGLLDCNKDYIITGDIVKIKNTDYEGPVFWNIEQRCFGVFFGLWYGLDKYNPHNYGKFIGIPRDNGMRMELQIINRY